MGFSFLVPAFFAGAALLAAPYLIHRIRRPEREPIRFSSLLFIPDVTKQVIERRRIQHILLMLLRMGVLALLALAFARPYWRSIAGASAEEGARSHVILLDASYSMGGGLFDQAKAAARDLVAGFAPGERVGIIIFSDRAVLAAPLRSDTGAGAGSPEAARLAIDTAALTNASTNFVPALELAQHQLLGDSDAPGVARGRYLIHLVTDAQRAGLPEKSGAWKVSPAIELDIVPVGSDARRNFAIVEVQVRPAADGSRRVLGKLRNWTTQDESALRVRLVLDEKEIAAKEFGVKARSAIQVSFDLPQAAALEGYLEVDDPGILADNRRYFSFSPPPQSRVAILTGETPETLRTPAWFFGQAIPTDAKSLWRVERTAPADIAAQLTDAARRPDVVIIPGLAGLTPEIETALRAYLNTGGHALLALDPSQDAAGAGAALLEATGITAGDLHRKEVGPGQFDLLSWIDFDHPIFVPFQGARTNDFSSVRFFNYQKLSLAEPARTLARFEDSAPAIVESALGSGKILVWPFALRLEWTTLPKSARFVPLLFESLAYLSGHTDERAALGVGQDLLPGDFAYNEAGEGEVWVPGEAASKQITQDTVAQVQLAAPGLLRLRPAGAAEWSASRPVNVDAREGDVERLPVDEFRARLAAAQALPDSVSRPGIVGADMDAEGYTIDKEYGRAALAAVCLLVLIECLYMTRLSTQGAARRAPAPGA